LRSWTIPAERAKNGRAHVVHLAEPARAILAELPRVAGADHVFPGRTAGRDISAFSKCKLALDAAIAAERAKTGMEQAAMADWRFHDFRRTAVTALAGMGFAPHVCDRLLNHLTGAIQGVAAVYQRHDFAMERAKALDAWAGHVLRTAEGDEKAGDVVVLRSGEHAA
jgi:integrase